MTDRDPAPPPTVARVAAAVHASWGPDTAYASAEYMARNAGCPSRGQCGTVALVVQDLLGGDLLVAATTFEGRPDDAVHYWNRLPDGAELDLTADQFVAAETVLEPVVVVRPAQLVGPGAAFYERLRARVTAALAAG